MPRQARLDAPGTLHHVIVRGIEKCVLLGKTILTPFAIRFTKNRQWIWGLLVRLTSFFGFDTIQTCSAK